jgi:hypothetical protein
VRHPGELGASRFRQDADDRGLGDNTANVALHRTAADTELSALVLFR